MTNGGCNVMNTRELRFRDVYFHARDKHWRSPIVHIDRASFEVPYTEQSLHEYLVKTDTHCVVGFISDMLVCYMLMTLGRTVWSIDRFAVYEPLRRYGIGSHMLHEFARKKRRSVTGMTVVDERLVGACHLE